MQLPELFTLQFDDILPEDEQRLLFETLLCTTAPTAVRTHPIKYPNGFSEEESIPWSQYGKYLSQRPSFTLDPLFHAGAYYVQDASTQLLEHIIMQLHAREPLKTVLDMCAAPGGKTTHLLSCLGEETLVVANEVIASRVSLLEENTAKWGYPNVVLLHKDPKYFAHIPDFFDCVVVDAPCSGEGLFRKDPQASSLWSPELVMQCHTRQKRILADSLSALRPGGYLIYSTCTYNYFENEAIVEWLQDDYGLEPVFISFPEEWNLLQTQAHEASCYRTFPHRVRGEGFFVTVLRKPLGEKTPKQGIDRKSAITLKQVSEKRVSELLQDPKKYLLFEEKGTFYAFPKKHSVEFLALVKELWPESFGVKVAVRKGADIVPTHELALSLLANTTYFPVHELSLHEAQQFQRKEPLVLEAPEGYVLLTYQQVPLGFIKVSRKKISNLYPMDLRVRMTEPLE